MNLLICPSNLIARAGKIIALVLFLAFSIFITGQNDGVGEDIDLNLKLSFQIDKQYLDKPNAGWTYFPQNRFVYVYMADHTRVIDISDGAVVKTLPSMISSIEIPVSSISKDESRIVVYGLFDKASELWDAKTGDLVAKLPQQNYGIRDVLWSYDSKYFILSAGTYQPQKEHTVFQAATGKIAFKVKAKHRSSVEFSPTKAKILTTERLFTYRTYRRSDHVKLWDGENGTLLGDLHISFKPTAVNARFSADGESILVWSLDTVSRVDVFSSDSTDLMKTIDLGKKVYSSPNVVSFSPDGNYLLIGVNRFRGIFKEDETWFRLYDTATYTLAGELRTNRPSKHQVETHQVVWRSDSKVLVSAGERYQKTYGAEGWEISNARHPLVIHPLIAKRTRAFLEGGYDYFDQILFTADSRFMITLNHGKTDHFRIWDSDTGILLKGFDRAEGQFSLTSDSRYVVQIGTDRKTISLYELTR